MGKEEFKKELKELLKENLQISVYEDRKGGTKYLKVEISFDGEKICEDEYEMSNYNDYGY